MPCLAKLILPYLVPVHGSALLIPLLKEEDDHFAQQYPEATLDLLWTILPENPDEWPYRSKDVLGHLAQAPETSEDARLSELKLRSEW